MTVFYQLTPYVPANQLGLRWETDDDSEGRPKGNTSWAELEFEFTLQNQIIHTMSTIAVTAPLRNALVSSGLTGFHFGDRPCDLSIARWAENPDEIRASLQPLYCLVITGTAMTDDFGLGTGRLKLPYISQAAADLIVSLDPGMGNQDRIAEVDSTGWPVDLPR